MLFSILKHKYLHNVNFGKNVKISPFTNLYGCTLGDDVFVGPFVEIQRGVTIGNGTRISSHTFICEGVDIGENVFLAHGVMFINDKFTEDKANWILRETSVGNNVRIGSNATLLPVNIGNNSIIGAGTIVTKDVKEYHLAYGNPMKCKDLRK